MRFSEMLRKIPKHTHASVFFLETVGLTYCCLAGAFGAKLEMLHGIADLPRIILPVAAASCVLHFRNGQRTSSEPRAGVAVLDILFAGVAVLTTEFVVSFLRPDWVMPRWAPTQGGYVGFCFLTAVRTAFPAGPAAEINGSEISNEELEWRLSELTRTSRRNRYCSFLVALAVIGLSITAIHKGDSHLKQLGAFLSLLFAVWLGGCAVQAALSYRSKDFRLLDAYRLALREQREFLARSLTGFVAFLLPGVVCMLYGTHVYEFVVVIYLLAFAEFLRRKFTQCIREIGMVAALSN